MEKLKGLIKNKGFYLWCICAVFFVLIYILNLHTGYSSDDFKYRFFYNTLGTPISNTKKVTNFFELFGSISNHYKLCNGRITAHFLLQFMLMFPRWIFRIVNSIMYVLLGGLIYLHANPKKDTNIPLLTGIFVLMWFCLPQFGVTVLWASGTANYLWMSVLILLFLLPYRKYAEEKDSVKNNSKTFIYVLILGLIAGCSSENSGGAAMIFTFLCIIYYAVVYKKIPAWSIGGLASSLTGIIVLIKSPSNVTRLTKKIDYPSFIRQFDKVYNDSVPLLKPLLAVLAAVLIVYIINKLIKRDFCIKTIPICFIYIICAAAAILVLTLSKITPARSWFCSVVFIITVAAILFSQIKFGQKSIKVLLCIGFIGVMLVSYKTEFKNINSSYQQFRQSENAIIQAKKDNKSEVTIYNLTPTKSKYDLYSGSGYFTKNIIYKPDGWLNRWMEKFYDIKAITSVPRE